MDRLSDAELVASALSGSQEAFRQLVTRFERPVYTLVLRMVRDPSLAEDLAQEVFVKAFRRLDTYDPARKLASWLFKIAHNTTIDHLRRSEIEVVPLTTADDDDRGDLMSILSDPSSEDPAAAAERRDMARSLSQAIAGLRSEYRAAVLMRYVEDLSYPEIAEVTGLPLGTVKTNLHRARKELAQAMSGRGWGLAESAAQVPADR
ncbi:MAG: RNA polymerase sigma factor [Solirubrobacterales bacterium]